jgi:hypothetical protein
MKIACRTLTIWAAIAGWLVAACAMGAVQVIGPPAHQILKDDVPGAPEPPSGPWLGSTGLPRFEAKVLINGTIPGESVAACIAETMCVSGALAGRPEIFIKVIGPRPNGFLWSQISRFTPSRVQVWLRRKADSEVKYYDLAAVPPGSDDISGLQDREAFQP